MATGSNAKVYISHEDVDSGKSLASQTTLSNLSWNSDTTGNYITVKNYAEDIDGYEYDSCDPSKVYLQSAGPYYATIYYAETKQTSGNDAKVIIYHEDVDTGETVATKTTLSGLTWNSENNKNYVTVANQVKSINNYEYHSCEDTKVILNESTTYYTTIYYKRISGSDAQVVIYHKDVDTGATVKTNTTLSDLTWNSTNTGNYISVANYAETITGYKYDSVSDSKIYLQAAKTYYATIYYKTTTTGNDAKVIIYHKDKDTDATIATDTTLTGLTWNSASTGNYITVNKYVATINGYTLDSVSKDTIYLQASTTYYATIYYQKISGNDASLKVYHRISGTNTDITNADVYSGLSWNSTHNNNVVTLTDQKYIQTIDGYTYVESVPSKVVLNASKQYEATIYYKASTTGNNAKVVIYHKDKESDVEIATATTLNNLYWNSETEGNFIEVKNYPATVDGYVYDSADIPKVILQAPTTYYATAYYRKTKGSNASLLIKYVDCDNPDNILSTKTYDNCTWNSENDLNTADLTSSTYIEPFDGYEYVESVPPIVVFKEPKQYEAEIRYRALQTATFYVSNVMPTSFELTVELTAPFTADNYQQIIFTGNKEDYSGAFLKWTVDEATSTGTTQIISTDKNGMQLTPGNTYTVYCYAQAKNGLYYPVKTVDGEAYTEVTLPAMAVTDGIYGKWCALFNTPEAIWSNNSVCFEFAFTEIYPFCSKYFAEIGVIAEEFIEESDALPGTPLAFMQATDMETTVVQLFIENLAPGTVQPAYLYIKTLEGVYVPIPFGADVIVDTDAVQSLAEQMQTEFDQANMDLTNRPQVSWTKMNAAHWDTPKGSYSTVDTVTYLASDLGLTEYGSANDYAVNVTPILPNGTVIDNREDGDGLRQYIIGKLESGQSLESLNIFIGSYESIDEAVDAAIRLHELQEEYYALLEGTGIFGTETITKPNTLGYTAGYAPVTGNAVNLLASDILQFISAADCTARWVFDRTEAGINSNLVIQNENIYAATFQEFASFIIDVSNNVSFVNNFQYVNAGDKIEASNLNELPISLNNMLGAL